MSKSYSGHIVDIISRRVFPGTILVEKGKISEITETTNVPRQYIVPGFVDSHIHIESSMLTPYEFSRIAMLNGTVGAVADPHEIANVMGVEGIDFMIQNAESTPMKIVFGAPSCVPAVPFETSGAVLDSAIVSQLLTRKDIHFLAEMMNVPGVINKDKAIYEMLQAAQNNNKPIDGHAPQLSGESLKTYSNAGISTDHECTTIDEAMEKIQLGFKILIREGSAAKDFDALASLIDQFPDQCMLCSDDKHPDDLQRGHINELIRRGLKKGLNIFNLLQAASLNPIRHYNLPIGLLQKNDCADFVIVDNMENLKILETIVGGVCTAQNGTSTLSTKKFNPINCFSAKTKKSSDFQVSYQNKKINIIQVIDGQLITKRTFLYPENINGFAGFRSNTINKIAVINRYKEAPVSVGFVENFGLNEGAIASSVAHDAHNIIVVGSSDDYMEEAVNLIIKSGGGISAVSQQSKNHLPLPVAGLISDLDYLEVSKRYQALDHEAKALGSKLKSPYMTLSFMTLSVIPKLKINDKGLFDVSSFSFIDLYSN